MPVGSEAVVPPLPHTIRPLGVRLAISVLGAVMFGLCVFIWLAFPPEIRAKFTVFQLSTLVVLGGMIFAVGYALARSRIVATEAGVRVVNGYRARRFEWNELLAVSLRRGSPWAILDLSDGTSVPAMGIQGSDGARAVKQVRELRALIDAHTH